MCWVHVWWVHVYLGPNRMYTDYRGSGDAAKGGSAIVRYSAAPGRIDLRRDILDIVRYAVGKEMWVVVGTNGVRITDELPVISEQLAMLLQAGYSLNGSLMRLAELETLRDLAKNANARLYLGMEPGSVSLNQSKIDS